MNYKRRSQVKKIIKSIENINSNIKNINLSSYENDICILLGQLALVADEERSAFKKCYRVKYFNSKIDILENQKSWLETRLDGHCVLEIRINNEFRNV